MLILFTNSDEDKIRVLVATDTHIGYMERDPIRANDSFESFEEILKMAHKLQVDFVLLGGDLFHDNKPSRRTLYRTMEIMRKYCFGDSPIHIQIVSDQAINFPNTKIVNYEDPNFNVSIPIFSIHGNHDDPAGDGALAALDLLSITSFVNYFGKSNSVEEVIIHPILMQKGKTKLAIYGLGNIRDERLHRMFFQKKVKFMRPREATDDWFNIMLLHQNRVAHSPKNFIPEQMLENFLDLIIWGHEHECKIVPAPCSDRDFYITQPGSSIATSLSEYEAKKKHVGLLEVVGSDFRLKPVPLTTVRPFIIDEVVLSEALGDSTDLENENEAVMELLTKKVNEMIAKAEEETRGTPAPKQPLIRLKVEYAGYETINPQRFGQRFVGKVANPNDILLFYRKKTTNLRAFKDKQEEEDAAEEMLRRATAASRPDALDEQKMEDLITQFLGPTTSLDLLTEVEFNDALYKFVEKDEKNAIADFVAKKLHDAQSYLGKADTSIDKAEDVHSMVQEMSKRTTTLKTINSSQPNGASLNVSRRLTAPPSTNHRQSDAMDVDKPKPSSATKTPASKSKAASSKSATKSAAPTKQTPLTATISPTVQTTLTSFTAPKSAPTVGKKRSRVSALEIFGGQNKADGEDEDGPPKKKIKIKQEKDVPADIVDSDGDEDKSPKPSKLAKSSSSSSKSSKKNNNDSNEAGSDDEDSGLPLLNTSISSPTPRNWGPRKKTT